MCQTEYRQGAVAEFNISKIIEALQTALDHDYEESFAKWSADELENYRKFLLIMAELDWPAFLEGDTEFHSEIISLMEAADAEGIANALYEYYDPLFLKWVEDRFEESSVIIPDRLPVIREAFLLYQLGYYYGTVAILIPQIEGILTDIDAFISRSGRKYSEKNLKLIDTLYKVSKANEKGKVIKTLLEAKEIDSEGWEYDLLIGYLRMKILKDNLPEEELSKHPNRHAFCHGEQCNYGTKEHALKAILCVNALEYVASVIAESDGKLEMK